ncbi:MAG TPA: lysophospholipid acyltransferase family protein [Acidimicrobiales bacterium]|nr:lysophospholipid acyltransferase family protein [Acidimicrobiales bacterium]
MAIDTAPSAVPPPSGPQAAPRVAPGGSHRWGHAGLLAPVVGPLSQRIQHEASGSGFGRDGAFVGRQVKPVHRYTKFFSPEVRGLEHLPATGPVLVVGNHSCLFYMPDAWVVAEAIICRRGLDQPAYALAYDLLFAIPGVGSFLRRIGAIPAAGASAEQALAEGAALVVYPGGDMEACRPWTQRGKVDLAGRRGFIRLALRTGVPVVPVVAHGAHDAVMVVARGDRLARVFGLKALRINVFPILLGPFGLTSILTPPPPLPSAVTVEFLPALDWSGLPAGSEHDEAVVSACYDEITGTMQGALDRLRAEIPHPLATGLASLVRGGRRPGRAPEGGAAPEPA